MANDYQKMILSGSTNGKAVKITTTGTPGDLLHTATSDSTGSLYDEIWIWLQNTSASAVLVTFEFGGASAPDQNIKVTVPAQSGLLLGLPGLILNNALTVKAFAASANVITATGYVNRITHS